MVSLFMLTISVSVLSLIGVVVCQEREIRVNHLAAAWSSLNLTVRPTPARTANTCPGCVSSRTNIESSLSNSEVTSLRIEYIKQQILKKLRLKEPPTVKKSSAKLPEPLVQQEAIGKVSSEKTDDNEIYDDFYGKTDQVILFPQEGKKVKCEEEEEEEDGPSVCVPFQLPAELQADEVTSAELWIYQTGSGDDFVVSEMSHTRSKRETNMKDGWLKFDIALEVKSWLEFRELSHAIHIVCTSCDESSELPISLEADKKPFLLITTDSLSKSRRLKRNMSCAPGMTECCREELYISFAEIGWDDWILQPHGYNAYFCRGSCTNTASITNSGSHYNTVIRKLLYEKQNRGQKLELVPCCTASRLSSVQLLYMDTNNTVTKKTLPNMVVDSCGCM